MKCSGRSRIFAPFPNSPDCRETQHIVAQRPRQKNLSFFLYFSLALLSASGIMVSALFGRLERAPSKISNHHPPFADLSRHLTPRGAAASNFRFRRPAFVL
jgi:hypothetical protein